MIKHKRPLVITFFTFLIVISSVFLWLFNCESPRQKVYNPHDLKKNIIRLEGEMVSVKGYAGVEEGYYVLLSQSHLESEGCGGTEFAYRQRCFQRIILYDKSDTVFLTGHYKGGNVICEGRLRRDNDSSNEKCYHTSCYPLVIDKTYIVRGIAGSIHSFGGTRIVPLIDLKDYNEIESKCHNFFMKE
jgi:hypothetical protein